MKCEHLTGPGHECGKRADAFLHVVEIPRAADVMMLKRVVWFCPGHGEYASKHLTGIFIGMSDDEVIMWEVMNR